MMEVQSFLKSQVNVNRRTPEEALGQLKGRLGIKNKLYDDRVVLNYCQIDSPKTDSIVRECRGLILSFPEFEVMARGYDRFYNYGEAPEFTNLVDFSRSVIYEKADGSYISVYHDNTQWQVATRGTAFAETENYSGRTFRELVDEAFECDVNEVFTKAGIKERFTFIFELTGPENRVVTRYKKPKMILTGIRDKISGEFANIGEYSIDVIPLAVLYNNGYINMRFAKTFDISTPEAALEAAKKLENLEEGFVAYDPVTQERVKIKSPTYVAVHHIRGEGLTPKRCAHLVTCGEVAEYLEYFPEDLDQIDPYMLQLDYMMLEAEKVWENSSDIEEQKEFALKVKDMIQSPLMFMAKKNNSSPTKEFMLQKDTMKIKMLLKYMGIS